jgi:hypothetical protein
VIDAVTQGVSSGRAWSELLEELDRDGVLDRSCLAAEVTSNGEGRRCLLRRGHGDRRRRCEVFALFEQQRLARTRG